MSRSIDLFIRSGKPPEEVAADLARLTELTLVRSDEPESWVLDHSEVHAQLRVHHFVDDGDLVLRRYQYALSSRVEHGGRPADSKSATLFRQVSAQLRAEGMECLLVHDMQYRDGGETHPTEDSNGSSEAASGDPAGQVEEVGQPAGSEPAP